MGSVDQDDGGAYYSNSTLIAITGEWAVWIRMMAVQVSSDRTMARARLSRARQPSHHPLVSSPRTTTSLHV